MSFDPRTLWDRLRTGFWFVPLLLAMAACGLALGVLAIEADVFPDGEGSGLPLLHDVDRIRDVLSTLVGATVTLLGLAFSLTLVAVTVASQQYGPRLVRGLLRSRGTQVVLGMFVGSFLYSILVLTGSGDSDAVRLAVLIGIVLMVLDVLALVWFLHHVARSVHPATGLVAARGEFMCQLDPPPLEACKGSVRRAPNATFFVRASDSGYLTVVDYRCLLELAAKHDLQVRVPRLPGVFVLEGNVVLEYSSASGERLPPDKEALLRDAIATAADRTAVQDPFLSLDQIVDVALRALSSGVNDPNTAISAVHVIGECLAAVGASDREDFVGCDASGEPRIWVERVPFQAFVDAAVLRVVHAARDQPDVRGAVADILDKLRETVEPGSGVHDVLSESLDALDPMGADRAAYQRDVLPERGACVVGAERFGARGVP